MNRWTHAKASIWCSSAVSPSIMIQLTSPSTGPAGPAAPHCSRTWPLAMCSSTRIIGKCVYISLSVCVYRSFVQLLRLPLLSALWTVLYAVCNGLINHSRPHKFNIDGLSISRRKVKGASDAASPASTAHLFNCLHDIDISSDTRYTQASRITLSQLLPHPSTSPLPSASTCPLSFHLLCIFRPIARLLIKDERCESCAMRSAVKFIKIANGSSNSSSKDNNSSSVEMWTRE